MLDPAVIIIVCFAALFMLLGAILLWILTSD